MKPYRFWLRRELNQAARDVKKWPKWMQPKKEVRAALEGR